MTTTANTHPSDDETITLAEQAAEAASRLMPDAASRINAIVIAGLAIRQARGLTISDQPSAPSADCQANTSELGRHRWISAGYWLDTQAGWCNVLTCHKCPALMLSQVNSHTRDFLEAEAEACDRCGSTAGYWLEGRPYCDEACAIDHRADGLHIDRDNTIDITTK